MPSISIPALATTAISAAGSILPSVLGSNAASSAADAQTQAAQLAAQTQLQMYNQTRSDLSPFMSTGGSAMSQLASLFGFGPGGSGAPNSGAIMSALQNFPGYQFGQQQGLQALDRSAASRGLLLSGAQLQDAQKFGTNYALQTAWQPYVSTLQSFANLGENAAAGLGNTGVSAGNSIAQSQLAAGQAQAAGQAANANIWSQFAAPGGGLSQLAGLTNSWWPSTGAPAISYTGNTSPLVGGGPASASSLEFY